MCTLVFLGHFNVNQCISMYFIALQCISWCISMYFTQDEQPEPEVFNPCRYFHNWNRSAFVLLPILFPRLRNTNMSALTLRIEFLRTWVLVVMTMALILMWSTKWWCIEIAVNRLTICKVMFLWSGSGKWRIYLNGQKRQKGQCTSPSTSFSPSLSSSPSSRSSTLSSCFPSGHKCQEGQCTPADKGKKGYKCVCRTGYEGRFCETKSKLYHWVFYLFPSDLIFVVMLLWSGRVEM